MPDPSDFCPKLKHKFLTAERAIEDVGCRGDPKVMTPDDYRKYKNKHIIKDIVATKPLLCAHLLGFDIKPF